MDVQVKSQGFETASSSPHPACHAYGRLVLATAIPVMRCVGTDDPGPNMSCGRCREMCEVLVPSGCVSAGGNVRSLDHFQVIPSRENACRIPVNAIAVAQQVDAPLPAEEKNPSSHDVSSSGLGTFVALRPRLMSTFRNGPL